MKRVIYFSLASADIDDSDVDAIVARAQERNAQMQVTGALCYNGRNFCQLLEGAEATLDRLLAAIGRDPRHQRMTVIDEKPITRRAFPDWTMHRVDNLDIQHIIDAMKA